MDDEIYELYQQVILDHNKNPRNFKVLEGANRIARGQNPLCGDEVTVYLHMDEKDLIKDISFQGSGCAIFKASASIMTSELKGKTRADAERLFEKFQEMSKTGHADTEKMGKLAAFAGVHRFPARVKCAVLSWHAVKSALEGKSDQPVSTE